MILYLAAKKGWKLSQMDVRNAFWNGDLEEIFIKVPPGLKVKGLKNPICNPSKFLYGLHQSPQAQYSKVSGKFISEGFKILLLIIL